MTKKETGMKRKEILYSRLLIHFTASGNLDDYTEEQKQGFELILYAWIVEHKEYWDIIDTCTMTINDFIIENPGMEEPTPLLYKIMDVIFKDINDYSH